MKNDFHDRRDQNIFYHDAVELKIIFRLNLNSSLCATRDEESWFYGDA